MMNRFVVLAVFETPHTRTGVVGETIGMGSSEEEAINDATRRLTQDGERKVVSLLLYDRNISFGIISAGTVVFNKPVPAPPPFKITWNC